MNAPLARKPAHSRSPVLGRLLAALVIVGLLAGPTLAETAAGVALQRIVTEIRELHRLVFLLKQDEHNARVERDQVAKYRAGALRFANGGQHPLYQTGFAALLRKYEQSPNQAKMLQMYVPALDPDNFRPVPEESFDGGDVSQLLEFCRRKSVYVRYGSRAQLIMAELTRDMVHESDAQLAELDQRIELYKAQNIAHTDLIGRLMLCARHCHGCGACYHYGYGACGGVDPLVAGHPIAGLNSLAYDVSRNSAGEPTAKGEMVATDASRLKFLKSAEGSDDRQLFATDHIAKHKAQPRRTRPAQAPKATDARIAT